METEPHFLRKLGRGPVDLAAQTAGITSGCQDGHHCWDMEGDTMLLPYLSFFRALYVGFPFQELNQGVCWGWSGD